MVRRRGRKLRRKSEGLAPFKAVGSSGETAAEKRKRMDREIMKIQGRPRRRREKRSIWDNKWFQFWFLVVAGVVGVSVWIGSQALSAGSKARADVRMGKKRYIVVEEGW